MRHGIKTYELSLAGAIEKIEDDLTWRGSNGKRLAHVVLSTEHASIILGALRTYQAEEVRRHQAAREEDRADRS